VGDGYKIGLDYQCIVADAIDNMLSLGLLASIPRHDQC
jgi:hypothetical protein